MQEKFFKCVSIVERAETMGITVGDRMTNIMDIENAAKQFNLRLDEMLNGDDLDFAHDYIGIQNNMNRKTGKVENFFLPRYAE